MWNLFSIFWDHLFHFLWTLRLIHRLSHQTMFLISNGPMLGSPGVSVLILSNFCITTATSFSILIGKVAVIIYCIKCSSAYQKI